MGGAEIVLIIKIGIIQIIRVMIRITNLMVLIRTIIKDRILYQKLYKLVNWEDLLKLLGIRLVIIYQ